MAAKSVATIGSAGNSWKTIRLAKSAATVGRTMFTTGPAERAKCFATYPFGLRFAEFAIARSTIIQPGLAKTAIFWAGVPES
jgi:hypothetical protein